MRELPRPVPSRRELIQRLTLPAAAADVTNGQLRLDQALGNLKLTPLELTFHDADAGPGTTLIDFAVELEPGFPGLQLGANPRIQVTLESLDTLLGTSIDALTISSLDAIAAALLSKLAAVNTSHQLGFFDGSNIEAVLETPEQSIEGRRVRVRGFEPRSDATTIFGSIRYRNRVQDTLSQTAEAAVNNQGRCTLNRDTKLARARARIPAGTTWTYAMGVEPDFRPTGKR